MVDGEQAELRDMLANMSPAIADLLTEMMQVGDLTWEQTRTFRDRIVSLNAEATKDKEKTALVFAFTALMDKVEALELIAPSSLSHFRNLREADYRMLLCVQATVDGVIQPDLLENVAQREVHAGRLAPDNDFREFIAAGAAALGKQPPPPKRRGWLGGLFGKRAR
jgi:hypothetical protein